MARKEPTKTVRDGDSFSTSSRKNDVRLADVDAPEKGQPGYGAAKQKLESLIAGETVKIETVAHDKYGRCIAKVKVGRTSVNNEMKKFLGKK